MKRLLLIVLLISINFTFGQSGSIGGLGNIFKNSSVMIGMNQSFYGTDWNEVIDDIEDQANDVDKNPFRKLNFTLMNEFDYGVLGGVKYLSYGFDYDFSYPSDDDYYYTSNDIDLELELKFLKLFVTYPLNNGVYFGLEGGYFIEGESKYKDNSGDSDTESYDRDFWTDTAEFSEFDYGLLGQFYYTINENILATVEGYYGLSKFSEDNDEATTGFPNVFHYVNLGLIYKFSNKITK